MIWISHEKTCKCNDAVGLQTPRKNGDEPATCEHFWDNSGRVNRLNNAEDEKAYLDKMREEVKTVLDNL